MEGEGWLREAVNKWSALWVWKKGREKISSLVNEERRKKLVAVKEKKESLAREVLSIQQKYRTSQSMVVYRVRDIGNMEREKKDMNEEKRLETVSSMRRVA
jgi:hypothetical protein